MNRKPSYDMPGPSDYGPSLAMTLSRPVDAYFGETKPKCPRSFRGRVIADSLGVSSQQADQQPTYAQIIAYLEVARAIAKVADWQA